MSNNQKKLEHLQLVWYKKLQKDKKFKDIEDAKGRLTTWSISHINSKPHRPDRVEYFRLAGHFLHDKKFPSSKYKKIWRMHSEGLSLLEISKREKQLTFRQIRDVIDKLRKKFYYED